MRGEFRLSVKSKRLWRSLIGVAVAYAVAVQSLLIVLGGFSLPADAGHNAPAFELCLHNANGAPALPAGTPDHSGCTHCIFCFARSHHAMIGAPLLSFYRGDYVEVVGVSWVADRQTTHRWPAHSIASPRGPPLGA